MTILREYALTILLAFAGLVVAAYYFNQLLTGVVAGLFELGR